MPITKGRQEIYAILATVADSTQASRLTLIDSEDFAIVEDGLDINAGNNRRLIYDGIGLANADGQIGVVFPEPLKTIRGISMSSLSTNLVGGKIFVYTR